MKAARSTLDEIAATFGVRGARLALKLSRTGSSLCFEPHDHYTGAAEGLVKLPQPYSKADRYYKFGSEKERDRHVRGAVILPDV